MSEDPNLPSKSASESGEAATETQREHVRKRLVALRGQFSGPLPPPAILEGYERICPGAAQRLIAIVEEEAAHRRKTNSHLIGAAISEGRRAQWMAFAIVFGFLIAGVILGINGHPVSGTILGSTGVGTIVVAFLKHRSRMSKETGERDEDGD